MKERESENSGAPAKRRFNGARLRTARTVRCMTATELARLADISVGSISHYERKGVQPKPAVARRLAEALEVPRSRLYKDGGEPEVATVRYRSLAAPAKRARASAEANLRWLADLMRASLELVELPSVDVPALARCEDPNLLTLHDVEQAADETRRAWGLGDGPIGHVLHLLEGHGVLVALFPFETANLDALGLWAEEHPFVALNEAKGTHARHRFDMAHELGHFVMHRAVPHQLAHRPEVHKLMENQAHRFASSFLFPEVAFADEFYSIALDELIELKRRWGLSAQAIGRRARDLQYITKDQYRRLCIRFSRAGWRRREPLDDVPLEHPRLVGQAVLAAAELSGLSVAEWGTMQGLSPSDTERLTGLRAPTGSGPAGNVVSLESVRRGRE